MLGRLLGTPVTATAITPATAAARRTLFPRARYVDRQRPAIHLFAVQRLDRGIGSLLACPW